MSVTRRATAVFMVLALVVLVPRLAWTLLDTYVLANPDSKFGVSGGVQFIVVFVGIAAVIAGATGVALVLVRKTVSQHVHLFSALVAGLALSIASYWIPELAVYGVGYSLFGEVGMIAVNWAAVCAVVLLLTQVIVGRALPPNSAMYSDTFSAPLRAPSSARNRGR